MTCLLIKALAKPTGSTLTRGGYRVKKIQPVDLFPFTEHVESVVCLSREKADDYVRISVHTKDLQTKVN